MKLKKLQLKGFKAFADKTEFQFHDGITAIVGPNGAGKSNLVDAFKWVLGEQSPRSLRGDQMSDVIFHGTDSRKPSAFAEVSLLFEQAQDTLPDGRSSLKLTRRLYRTGESIYLIDDAPVRLKDIRDLFAGTGVGHNAYSILEQDRINKILSANPEDRRLVFEEAAGISRYRARRIETERELERTNQNLEVIKAQKSGLVTRERSVRIQAGKARKFKEYTQQVNLLNSQLYIKKFQQLSCRVAALNQEEQARKTEVLQLESTLSTTAAETIRLEEENSSLSEKLRQFYQEKNACEGKVKSAQEKINYITHRIKGLKDKEDSLLTESASTKEMTESRRAQESSLIAQIDECAAAIAACENEVKSTRLRVYEVSTLIQEAQDLAEKLRQEGILLLESRTTLRNQASMLTARIEKASALKERKTSELESLNEKIAKLTESLAEIERKITDLRTESDSFSLQLSRKDAELAQIREEISSLRGIENSLVLTRTEKKSHFEVANSLLQSDDVLGAGTKFVLERKGTEGFASAKGLVADLLSVDFSLARAVDAALGPLSGAIVVSTKSDALALAALLKEQNAGPVTFLFPAPSPPAATEAPGDRLISHIRFSPEYSTLFESLLGQFYLVDSLQSIPQELADSCKFVTPDGELLSDWILRAGSACESPGLVSRKSELASLSSELEELDRRLKELRNEISAREDREREMMSDRELIQHKIESLRNAVDSSQMRKTQLEGELSATNSQVSAVQMDITDALSSIETDTRELKQVEAELETTQKRYSEVDLALKNALTQLNERTSLKESVLEQLSTLNAELAKKNQIHQNLTDLLTSKRQEIEDRIARMCALANEIKKTQDEQVEAVAQTEHEEREIEALVRGIADLVTQISVSEHNRENLSQEILRRKEEHKKLNERLAPAREALNQVIIAKTAAQTESNSLLEYANRELSINLSDHTNDQLPENIDLTQTDHEISELKKKMENFGNINMDAINELEEVSASLNHICAQEKDLIEAKEKLANIMKTIDEKCRVRLLEVLQSIRQNFYEIFRRLFGGGRADIAFEEGKDILEAGIEIVAKPPGKNLVSINLLSGGEKALTTIALLFAIFKANPSPFCILDEIDAPLDDTSTGKFLSLVRGFLAQSQFLIITHSQQTMQSADVLYGITMQEPGISTKISYTLKESPACEEHPDSEKEPELTATAVQ